MVLVDEMAQTGDVESLNVLSKEIACKLDVAQRR